MRKITINKQSGFTIVELLMALVFFSFILMFATASYIRINRSYVRGANVKLVQEETRKVVADISDSLRQAGSDSITIIDNDVAANCAGLNLNSGEYLNPLPVHDCRHRLCIGDKVYAWNQGPLRPNRAEHSWYEYVNSAVPTDPSVWLPFNPLNDPPGPTIPDPFGLVKTTAGPIGCNGNVEFLESSDLIDATRVAVQDLDIRQLNGNTYRIKLTLATLDNNVADNQDLNYQNVTTDEADGVNDVVEYRADGCFVDRGSQQFCYVETLSTIVTIR